MENLPWFLRLPILDKLSLKVLDLIKFNMKGVKHGDVEILFKDRVAETAICHSIYFPHLLCS